MAGFIYVILLSEARNKGSRFPNPSTGQTSFLETPVKGVPHIFVYVTHYHKVATIFFENLMGFFVIGFFILALTSLFMSWLSTRPDRTSS
jgi:hypothetical protein